MQEINNGIGGRIQGIRTRKKLSQAAFGARIGVSGRYIRMLEKGQRKPSQALVIAISVKFGVKVAWLRVGRNK